MQRISISFSQLGRAALAGGFLFGLAACDKQPTELEAKPSSPEPSADAPAKAAPPVAGADAGASTGGSLFDATTTQLDPFAR